MTGRDERDVPSRSEVLEEQVRELLDPLPDEEAVELLADGRAVARWLGGFAHDGAPALRVVLAEYRWQRFGHVPVATEEPAPGAEPVAVIAVTGSPGDIAQVREMLEELTDPEEPAPEPVPAPTVRAVVEPNQLDLLGGGA